MTKLLCIVINGDSIASSVHTWAYQALGLTGRTDINYVGNYSQTYFATNIIMKNGALGGTRLNTNPGDLVMWAPTLVDPIVANKTLIGSGGATRKYLYVNAIGSNDAWMGGLGSYSAFADAVAASCTDRKIAGFDYVAMATGLPRNDTLTNETPRAGYNGLLRDSSWRAARGIDFLLDLASDTTMDNISTCADTTYYADGVHPTTAGAALLAPIAASLFSTVLASF
jgi:lysophospholipase L1-like esterase